MVATEYIWLCSRLAANCIVCSDARREEAPPLAAATTSAATLVPVAPRTAVVYTSCRRCCSASRCTAARDRAVEGRGCVSKPRRVGSGVVSAAHPFVL